jgi:ABC-type Fe3+-hydroxamate transport system substrate-binding protein
LNFYTDQLNRKIGLPFPPKRIISLVPSQTELLYDIGLRDEVVGITDYCIHPDEWLKTKIHVGGTKKINLEKIKNLHPDLIIGNKEENDKEQIEELMKHYPVWMSDIYSLKDALDMVTRIGTLVGKNLEAVNLKLSIESQFNNISTLSSSPTQPRSAYFIWRKPYLVAGNNTFINDMLIRCGFNNIFAKNNYTRYPEISSEQLANAAPHIILLSSEPYPFKEKHIQEFQSICPNAKIMIVDGELFSWYGSRLLKVPAYFEKLRACL